MRAIPIDVLTLLDFSLRPFGRRETGGGAMRGTGVATRLADQLYLSRHTDLDGFLANSP